MKNKIISILLVAGISACASQPEKIQATYISPNEYSGLSCEELEDEMRGLSSRVSMLTGQLKEEANSDNMQMGVGLLLFWPALLFLEGGDGAQASEYALLKGKYEAVETKYKRNKCQNYVEKNNNKNDSGSPSAN
jgi:hypothetical protein